MEPIADLLSKAATETRSAKVELSNDLVPLLSEQLYQSPIKAIEELVVNSYDAAATVCRLFVPAASEQAQEGGRQYVVVFDDGDGMTSEALVNLWQVGRSPKSGSRVYKERKQIGKFGIGKIATYSIANRLTYVTKTADGILTSSLDFKKLVVGAGDAPPETTRVDVPVMTVNEWSEVAASEPLASALAAAGVSSAELQSDSWTVAILEDLKEKAGQIKLGRLKWVLRTAMPLKTDFKLFLNGEELSSSKSDDAPVVEFSVHELKDKYIQALNEESKAGWKAVGGALSSNKRFPSGVSGTVQMFDKSLFGKSDDLERSHGFFVRVRDRLVNLEDPLFGTTDLTHKYFSRFAADVNVDDLDEAVKAAREGVEVSSHRSEFVALLRALFNDARSRYDDYEEEQESDEKHEDKREYVPRKLVERPLADALVPVGSLDDGADADRSWFYFEFDEDLDVPKLVERLYTEKRSGFSFSRVAGSKTGQFVRLNPATSTFTFNSNHEFVRKHSGPTAASCLEDFAIAEVLLEVYLHEEGMASSQIGEVLQRRDELLRSLAKDLIQQPEAIAEFLRDSANDEVDLEIAMVAAARTLGFVAKHLSFAGKPDGVARLTDRPESDRIITLEAKSGQAKSHKDIDFATLRNHVDQTEGASGCMLVAPSYKGQVQDDEANAIVSQAKQQRISCWTVEQLARVVEAAESRHISADTIYSFVTSKFAPVDVAEAIEALFAETPWDQPALIDGILKALRHLEDMMTDNRRSIDMVTTALALGGDFSGIEKADVQKAVATIERASQGAFSLGGDKGDLIYLHTSLDEMEGRVAGLTKNGNSTTRKPGTFRRRP